MESIFPSRLYNSDRIHILLSARRQSKPTFQEKAEYLQTIPSVWGREDELHFSFNRLTAKL